MSGWGWHQLLVSQSTFPVAKKNIYVGPMKEIPRPNIFFKMPHRSKPLCNMSWQPNIGLHIMTSLPRRRGSVYFNYDNRPPTVSSGERTSSLSRWFTIHFANQGHWLTYLILSGVYGQPIKCGYRLVSCQGWTSNLTLNMGEGQPLPSRNRQVVCVRCVLAGINWRPGGGLCARCHTKQIAWC